jgi:DNA-binding transcriptional MerR regulator
MGTNLLTEGQVASRAGVHRTTVHHWEKDGKLQAATSVNGIRLFDSCTVDAFIAARSESNEQAAS